MIKDVRIIDFGANHVITLDRDFYQPLMADTYHNLAIVYLTINRLKEAKESAVEAYIIYKKMAKTNPKLMIL